MKVNPIINQFTPQYYFNAGVEFETRFDHNRCQLTIAPTYSICSEKENEFMSVFVIPFVSDSKIDFIDIFNANVKSEYYLSGYDAENLEFICNEDEETFCLPISDIEKAIKPHLKEIAMCFNLMLRCAQIEPIKRRLFSNSIVQALVDNYVLGAEKIEVNGNETYIKCIDCTIENKANNYDLTFRVIDSEIKFSYPIESELCVIETIKARLKALN
jgi:hypothetical protein